MNLKQKNLCAMTPPMGWNSWDCYASSVNEEQLLGNARYMQEHLLRYGWEYVTCDIQWSDPRAGEDRSITYIPFTELNLDAWGRQIPAENRFPSSALGRGFGPIAQRIHEMGLKFGIHIMRGIPRQAVHGRMPVLGTNTTADRIADPFSISKWNGDMYGVNPDSEGAQAWYDSIFRQYADWGVDLVKVDDICNTNMYPQNPYSAQREVEMIRRAIDACGRPMVLSLSPGPAVIEKAWHLKENANMWRITDDFWDRWDLLLAMFERCEVWQSHVGPGCWPDCDMLPLGRIGMGFGEGRNTRFTRDEQKTMMTLWLIFRSPLILGCELRECDEYTLSLITNPDALRLNRHSHGGRQVRRSDAEAVWESLDENGDGYLALFNLSEEVREVSVDLSDTGLKPGRMKELWTGEEMEESNTVRRCLRPHEAALIRIRA